MNVPDPKPLRRITTIALCGDPYDLAINGDHYHLVEHKEPDAYLRPVARKVEIEAWLASIPRTALTHNLDTLIVNKIRDNGQAVLDLLGRTIQRVAELEEELARAHAALQREAEPGATSRRPPARESAAGLPNVLEEEPK